MWKGDIYKIKLLFWKKKEEDVVCVVLRNDEITSYTVPWNQYTLDIETKIFNFLQWEIKCMWEYIMARNGYFKFSELQNNL